MEFFKPYTIIPGKEETIFAQGGWKNALLSFVNGLDEGRSKIIDHPHLVISGGHLGEQIGLYFDPEAGIVRAYGSSLSELIIPDFVKFAPATNSIQSVKIGLCALANKEVEGLLIKLDEQQQVCLIGKDQFRIAATGIPLTLSVPTFVG